MENVSISLYGDGVEPMAAALKLDTGDRFITLKFGDAATVILPGVNAEAVAYARSVQAALEAAIAELEPRDESVGLGEQPVVVEA